MADPKRRAHAMWGNSKSISAQWVDDGWWHVNHRDGTEQVAGKSTNKTRNIFIERVNKVMSRRKHWCVVDRRGPKGNSLMYPPKLSGPYKDLDAAKAEYLMIVAAHS